MSMFSAVNDSLGHRMSTDKTLNMIMREVEEGIESETSPEDIAISIYNPIWLNNEIAKQDSIYSKDDGWSIKDD